MGVVGEIVPAPVLDTGTFFGEAGDRGSFNGLFGG